MDAPAFSHSDDDDVNNDYDNGNDDGGGADDAYHNNDDNSAGLDIQTARKISNGRKIARIAPIWTKV